MPLLRILPVLLLMLAQGVAAQPPAYVGLIERLEGLSMARSAAGASFRPTAFSRLVAGDEFTLEAGTQMQVVYFASRRREQWRGPAAFRATADGSVAVSGSAAAITEIRGAPSRVGLAAAGNVQRIGGLTLRSGPGKVPDDAAVARAEADYAAWVAAAAADDILPELYMIGFLQERQQPELLAPYARRMLQKQPGHPDVRALAKRIGITEQ